MDIHRHLALGAWADTSPTVWGASPFVWHGTTTAHLPAILAEGLRPRPNARSQHQVCLALRPHVAHFWSRIACAFSPLRPTPVLLRIPLARLDPATFVVDGGVEHSTPYGGDLPHVQEAAKTAWDPSDWKRFAEAFGAFAVEATVPVFPEDVLVLDAPKDGWCLQALSEELRRGRPALPGETPTGAPIRPTPHPTR